MPTTTVAYRTTIGLIWGLALWHSWESRGLFVDGSAFLVQIARREWFFDFYAPRLYAMVVGQAPIMTAVFLGITDLHLLARLLSIGLFALPTALYTLALVRVKDDPVLLAAVIGAIGLVFMTTSFFIVGEYNTAFAIAIVVAVRLVTAKRLTVLDGLFLAVISLLAARTYESMIYLGPLLSVMVLHTLWRMPSRPWLPTTLYLLSTVGFIGGMAVAIRSLVKPWSAEHLDETIVTATNFWQNLQFDLAMAAALVVVVWGLVRPRDLLSGKPYRWAGYPPGDPGAVAAAGAQRHAGAAARQVAVRGAPGRRHGHRRHRPVHLVLRLPAARQARGIHHVARARGGTPVPHLRRRGRGGDPAVGHLPDAGPGRPISTSCAPRCWPRTA